MAIEHLQKKKELLSQIRDMTRAAAFTGAEEDARIFADLMENREKLFGQIKILDDKITDGKPCKEAERLLSDIRTIAGDIIALDKINGDVSSRILADIKKSLKGIKDSRSVSKGYANYIQTSDGMYFDTKN